MSFFFNFLGILLEGLALIILLRVVISWMSPGQTNQLTSILYLVTEPILAPLRRILPRFGRLDLSPMAAWIILQILIAIMP